MLIRAQQLMIGVRIRRAPVHMSLIKLNGPSKFPATFPPHKDVFLAKKVFPKHSDADVAEVGFRAETTGSGLYGCENHLAGNFCDDQTLKGH